MHRSGSTLVEQILASHPAIEGTAELTEMPNIVRQLGEASASARQSFDRYFAGLGADRLRALGETYLEGSRVYRHTDRAMFTDKMPNNWAHVGLIQLMLPNATIIDARRHPLGCCFSNWKQLYAKGLDHSNALDTMGRFYHDYWRFMRHFDAIQPGVVHRVINERLIDSPESVIRGLLDHCGLPFDAACLEFHNNKRAVRTPSAEQVRRPINRDGVDSWRNYERWLDPMKAALGETLDDWEK